MELFKELKNEPFIFKDDYYLYNMYKDTTYPRNQCLYCSNNPINGGSGVCHCILGSNVIY